MDIETVKKGFEKLEEGMRILGGGPLDYYVQRLTDCYELLINKYAPFKVGDGVLLTETPKIEPDSGWYGSRHFLVKGALAKVCNVEASGSGFVADIMFENETWIPDCDFPSQDIAKGVPQPVKQKHTYRFSEKMLVKVPHGTGVIWEEGS